MTTAECVTHGLKWSDPDFWTVAGALLKHLLEVDGQHQALATETT